MANMWSVQMIICYYVLYQWMGDKMFTISTTLHRIWLIDRGAWFGWFWFLALLVASPFQWGHMLRGKINQTPTTKSYPFHGI
jgi:hypothetical protein